MQTHLLGLIRFFLGFIQKFANLSPVFKVEKVYFETGYLETNIYLMSDLKYQHEIAGPAIIMDKLSTILVEPGCRAVVSRGGNLKIRIGDSQLPRVGPELDAIQLSIFSHRFMSIAEQMGRQGAYQI